MMKMSRRLTLSLALLVAAAVARPAAAQSKTALTPDGTLFSIQSGYYGALVPGGTEADPTDFVLQWTSQGQDGTVQTGLVPGTASPEIKDQFDLVYDSFSHSYFMVWNDRTALLNNIQFAIYQNAQWTQAQLLPTGVFTFANNPRLLVSHQTVTAFDAQGNTITYPRSIVSVIWWEDSYQPHARYAPIFIEQNGVSVDDIQIYDLPTVAGESLSSIDYPLTNPIYFNPALQADDGGSIVLATSANPGTQGFETAHITFPSDLRGSGNQLNAMGRGHVIIIYAINRGPLPGSVPPGVTSFDTIVGSGYRPTFFWQTDTSAMSFTTYDGSSWNNSSTIPLSTSVTSDKAINLIRAMAQQD